MEQINATEKTEKTETYDEAQETQEEDLEENFSLIRYLWDEVNRGQVMPTLFRGLIIGE